MILAKFIPSMAQQAALPFLGISISQLVCFLIFWGINMWVIHRGIHTIRLLLAIKAPLLIVLGLALLGWAYSKAGGFGPMLSAPSAFAPGQPQEGKFMSVFIPSLTGMVGFWATLSLNIPDFSRYARSQKDQVLGQAIGLPATMALYSFIGVAVTSATLVIFKDLKEPLWDPVKVLTRFENPVVLVVAMLAICIATLATNIAANVVSPANDFANLAPRKISFRTGGFITGIIGVLLMPWKLLALPGGYIFTWLVGYSALLGPIAGIMIADYFVIRRCKLDAGELYRSDGIYVYHKGFSYAGIGAFLLGALPSLPGFLVQAGAISGTHPVLTGIYQQAWFVGFAIAFVLYIVFRKLSPASIRI